MSVSEEKRTFRTYKYRLLPSKKQHQALTVICESQREIYNAALEERNDCYSKTGKGRSYVDQCKGLTELREEAEFSAIPLSVQRWTIKRVDEAYAAFFRRLRIGGKGGYPRFRGKGWWKAFGFRTMKGLRFDGKRLRFKGMPGGLRLHMHRPLPKDAELKSVVFRRDPKGWHVCLQCAMPAAATKHQGPAVGLHIGRMNYAMLSTGEKIPAPAVARRAERERRRRQRALQRSRDAMQRQGGQVTNGYLKRKRAHARQQQRIADARRTYQHQQSSRLAKKYKLIAMEDLPIENMAKRNRDKSKAVYAAAWGQFVEFLTYKAESAGGKVIRVKPDYTTRTCSRCGVVREEDAQVRAFHCRECGLVLNKHKNAALNILTLAVTGQGQTNAAARSPRSAGISVSID